MRKLRTSATSLERRAALSSHTSWTSHGLTQDSSGTPIAVTPLVGDGSNLWRLIRPTVGASRRLDCLGRWVPNRDAADARVVSYYDRGGPRSQPSSEDDVGGFPTLAPGTPCADSDHDGLPDAYEDARGLDKNDPRDASAPTPSGFTNLDLYLDGPEDGESP